MRKFISNALREIRWALHDFMSLRGWYQKDLVAHSGLGKSTISKALSGKSGMTARTLIVLAKTLDIPTSVLVMNPRLKVR